MKDDLIIQNWKNPDRNDDLAHPAGNAELNEEQLGQVNGGQAALTSLPCIIFVTSTISCALGCNTVVNGSCKLFTEGCCSFESFEE